VNGCSVCEVRPGRIARTRISLLDEFAELRAGNLARLRSWQLTAKELDLPGASGARSGHAAPVADGVGRARPRQIARAVR